MLHTPQIPEERPHDLISAAGIVSHDLANMVVEGVGELQGVEVSRKDRHLHFLDLRISGILFSEPVQSRHCWTA